MIIMIMTGYLLLCFTAEMEFGLTWVHFLARAVWLDGFGLSCVDYIVDFGICARKNSRRLDLITLLEENRVKQGGGRKSFHNS